MLKSFLNSHPNAQVDGELFARLNGRDYTDVLAKAFAKQPFYVKAKGFKIFYYHPLDDETSGIWEDLTKMEGLHVIHLKRKNILRTLISRKIAGIQDLWLTSSANARTSSEDRTVTFTAEELEEGFNQTREWERRGDKMFERHPLISIYYEDLVSDPEAVFRNVTEFLGIRYVPPKTALRKQNPEHARNLVSNYDELRLAFAKSEWQEFFNE
jgi:LPS sulfotransferase NodH